MFIDKTGIFHARSHTIVSIQVMMTIQSRLRRSRRVPPESDPVCLRLDVAYIWHCGPHQDMMNKLMEFVDRRLAQARTKIKKDLAEKEELERMKRNKGGGHK